MRLGNYLKQAGATAMTGREVQFQLRSEDKQGAPVSRLVTALILPLSEAERCATIRAARAYLDTAEDCGPYDLELPLFQIAAFLRDSENPRVRFATSDEIEALREGLTFAQVQWLMDEYTAHLRDQYPELLQREDVAQTKKDAEDFSEPAPGA